MNLYSVYDKVSKKYNYPYQADNAGTALRSLKTALNKRQSDLAAFAEDYELWHVGDYDENTGFTYNSDKKTKICNVVDMLPQDVRLLTGKEKNEQMDSTIKSNIKISGDMETAGQGAAGGNNCKST